MTGSLTNNSDSKAAVLTVNFASSSSALSTCFHPLCRAPLHCFRKYLHVEAFRIGIGIRKGRILLRVQTPQPEKKPRERETPGQTPQRSDAQQPAEQPRTVNRRALFPGHTAGSTSTSEGPAAGEGNAGDLSGAPEGSHDGTGQSDSGIAYDLSGRSVVGKLPKPSYPGNESGKVVVDVTVDASGRVTYASYRAQGSTTNSKRLVDAAVEAARKARFSSSESLMQTGTITYVFTLE